MLTTGYTTFKPVWSDGRTVYRIFQKAPGWRGSGCSDMDHEALCEALNKEAGLQHSWADARVSNIEQLVNAL